MAQNQVEWLRSLKTEPERARARHEQRMGEIAASEKAQTVVDHPGWQMYLDHLESICANLREGIEARKRAMIRGDELDADLTRMKLEIRAIEAQLSGIELAMGVIPELIKRGEKAAVNLHPMTT